MNPSPHRKSTAFKSIGLVSLITLCSRVLGLVREMVKAALLGTSYYSDAFTLAFTFPNLFRRLTAEGAMTSAFIPIFTELVNKEGERRAMTFARNFFWLFTLVLILFSLLFILFAPWLVQTVFAVGFDGEPLTLTILLTRYMFFYIVFISLAAVLQGILNAFEVFWISSLTPVLLNISIISCALVFAPRLSNPTYGFAAGVMLGGAIQLLVQLPGARRLGLRLFSGFSLSDPWIRKALTLMLPTLFGTGIYQINIIISNLIASTLNEGAISSLTFSNRLLELIIGIFVVSITTVYLPRFATLFSEQRLEELGADLQEIIGLTAFITLPATVGILIIGDQIVTLLFARGEFDTHSISLTAGALRYHILGLTFIAWNRILLTFFQAGRWLSQTVKIAMVVLIVNTVSALVLSRTTGHLGIAGANTISQLAQTILLVLYLHKQIYHKISGLFAFESLSKTIFISLLLFIGLKSFRYFLMGAALPLLADVCLTISFAVILYLGLALLLRCRELQIILSITHLKRTGNPRPPE